MKTAREKPAVTDGSRVRTALATDLSRAQARSAAATPPVSPPLDSAASHWTFLTNHAHVLALLSRRPSLVLRSVASQIGITERAVQRIIADLEACGIIEREKIGRRNRYRIRFDLPLRHPIESHRTIRELLAMINGDAESFRQPSMSSSARAERAAGIA